MEFTEEYLEVLQALEAPVMWMFIRNRGMLDDDVLDAYEALIKGYTRLALGKPPKPAALSRMALRVHTAVQDECEAMIATAPDDAGDVPLTIQELLACLKKLRKSVRTWSAEDGPQGYLCFITGGMAHPKYDQLLRDAG